MITVFKNLVSLCLILAPSPEICQEARSAEAQTNLPLPMPINSQQQETQSGASTLKFSDTEIVGGKSGENGSDSQSNSATLPKHYHNAIVSVLERAKGPNYNPQGSVLKLLLKPDGAVDILKEDLGHAKPQIGIEGKAKSKKKVSNRWEASSNGIVVSLLHEQQDSFSQDGFVENLEWEEGSQVTLPILSEQDVKSAPKASASSSSVRIDQNAKMLCHSKAKLVASAEVVYDIHDDSDWRLKVSVEFKTMESRVDGEYAFIKNACGGSGEAEATVKEDPANAKTAREGDPAEVAAKPIGTVNFVVNGKEFKIEILEWEKKTAHANPGAKSSQVYLPPGESYYGRGMRLANELGNLITDGRDGEMDLRTTSKDGTPTGLLGSEAESDRFSVSWISYQLSMPNAVFPFSDYLPKDQASRDLLNKLLDDQAMRYSSPDSILDDFSPGRSELYGELKYYRSRASSLEKAEGLVKEGKLKEAYEMILSNNGGKFKDYACKVLDSYRTFAGSSK